MMNKIDKKRIYTRAVEILNDQGHEVELREDYSGRGMYGDTTPGIVTKISAMLIGFAIIAALAEEMDDYSLEEIVEFAAEAAPRRTDSMGLSTIYY